MHAPMLTTELNPESNKPFCNRSCNTHRVSVGVVVSSRKSSGRTTVHCSEDAPSPTLLDTRSTSARVSANGGTTLARASMNALSAMDRVGSVPAGLSAPADASKTNRFGFRAPPTGTLRRVSGPSTVAAGSGAPAVSLTLTIDSSSASSKVSQALNTSAAASRHRNRGSPYTPSSVNRCPRACTTASHPRIASAIAGMLIEEIEDSIRTSRPVESPGPRGSMNGSKDWGKEDTLRTTARTSWPAPRRESTVAEPTRPVAPSTSTLFRAGT
mmetsp:Transcript_14438/g.58922  ORF Transcript_14438/g.58922 Transcript_14438/m.58922 type:complete len:270 (+) Transcript_14438:307-1116(+)